MVGPVIAALRPTFACPWQRVHFHVGRVLANRLDSPVGQVTTLPDADDRVVPRGLFPTVSETTVCGTYGSPATSRTMARDEARGHRGG